MPFTFKRKSAPCSWNCEKRFRVVQGVRLDKRSIEIQLTEDISEYCPFMILARPKAAKYSATWGTKVAPPLAVGSMEPLRDLPYRKKCRRSFKVFVSLGVMNDISQCYHNYLFRERLRRASFIDELFELFEEYLQSQGLQAHDSQITDATLAPAP